MGEYVSVYMFLYLWVFFLFAGVFLSVVVYVFNRTSVRQDAD